MLFNSSINEEADQAVLFILDNVKSQESIPDCNEMYNTEDDIDDSVKKYRLIPFYHKAPFTQFYERLFTKRDTLNDKLEGDVV